MDNYFKMQIPAIGENEAFARNVLASFSLDLSPTVEEINDLKTAVSEAVTNSVVHAYDKDGVIDLSAEIHGNVMYVTITDYGKGIEDVRLAREPFYTTRKSEERSGMGFTVMETFMDEVEVTSEKGIGTSVTMKKVFSNAGTR